MDSRENAAHLEKSPEWSWILSPGLPPGALAPILEAFPDPGGLPGVTVLKHNRLRTVFRIPPEAIPLAAGSPALRDGVIAKVYRYPKAWDRIRYRVLPSRADQEWRALSFFEDAGLPTATPIAVASHRIGGKLAGGGLIIRCLPDAVPLSTRLALPGSAGTGGLPPDSRRLLAEAGNLIRRMHDRGVHHRDLHAGNLLVCGPEERIHLIDLHSSIFRRRVSARRRRHALARLLHSLGRIIPEEGLRLVLEAYGADALGGGGLSRVAGRVRRSSEGLERTRIRSRSKRCFISSTSFAVHRARGERLYHARTHSRAELEAISRQGLDGLRVLKIASRGWMAAASTAAGPVCVKRRRYGMAERLRSLVASHPLRRAYAAGHAFRVRGIPTPGIIALREKRWFGLVIEADLVTEMREDAMPLHEFLLKEYWGRGAASGARARAKSRLAVAVGDLVRKLHSAGYFPHDLSPQNVLVFPARIGGTEGGPPVEIVDLDGLRRRWFASPRRRRRNLVQVANFPEGHVSAADRMRGLAAYARGEEPRASRAELTRLWRGLLAEQLRRLEELLRGERDFAAPAKDLR